MLEVGPSRVQLHLEDRAIKEKYSAGMQVRTHRMAWHQTQHPVHHSKLGPKLKFLDCVEALGILKPACPIRRLNTCGCGSEMQSNRNHTLASCKGFSRVQMAVLAGCSGRKGLGCWFENLVDSPYRCAVRGEAVTQLLRVSFWRSSPRRCS